MPPAVSGSCFSRPYAKRTLVLSIFNLMQTIAFYGFGSWVPTLLLAKGIHITTSLEYAFIIALANPVGPLLGTLIADRMGAQVADRVRWYASRDIHVSVRASASAWLVIVFGVLVTLSNNWISFVFHGYQAEQYPTRIRARAVGFVYSWTPGQLRISRIADRVFPAHRRGHGSRPLHRRRHGGDERDHRRIRATDPEPQAWRRSRTRRQ